MVIKNKKMVKNEAYEGILDSLSTAILYYDHNKCLVTANEKAQQILPHLYQSLSTLDGFISFGLHAPADWIAIWIVDA